MNPAELRRLSLGPYDDFIDRLVSSRYEYVGVILLGSDDINDHIGHRMLASGHQGRVRFDLADVVNAVQESGASGVILVHNHPSYKTLRPSQQDICVTQQVDDELATIGVRVVDHRIYNDLGECFSFVDNGVSRWGWEKVEFSM